MHVIYGLVDPRDQKEFYVGRTEDLYRRFTEHLRCTDRNDAKNARILELKALNLLPLPKTLEVIEDAAHAALREAYWIKHFRMLGYEITNDVVYSTYEQEIDDIPVVDITNERRQRQKRTGVARKVQRLLSKNPSLTGSQLAAKCGISASYAGKLKAKVLAEQSA